MKMTLMTLVCTLLFSSVAGGFTPPASRDGKLTAEDRAKAIKLLKDSETELLSYVQNLTDAQWDFKPSVAKWSVGQTVEHIALGEGLLFGAMQQALASKPNPEWETKTAGKDAFLEKILPNRAGKAQAPEAIQPLKRPKMTRAEIMTLFKENRAKSFKFIETTDLPLKEHTFDHPFKIFGTLNAYQWFIYIPLHNVRHNAQIAEVKASPNFPK